MPDRDRGKSEVGYREPLNVLLWNVLYVRLLEAGKFNRTGVHHGEEGKIRIYHSGGIARP